MKIFIGTLILCCLCVNTLAASEASYRAATAATNNGITPNMYAPIIHEAGKANVDILVLPAPEVNGIDDNYDETVKTLSRATRQAGTYVVAHLFEKVSCQNTIENVRSNLVFDRQGTIVSVYRKPTNNVANCTATDSDLVTFDTDFGTTFGLIMEEDVILKGLEHFQGVKNFALTGAISNEIPFLKGGQFLPSWSYIANANLVSFAGIYGNASSRAAGRMVIADVTTGQSAVSTAMAVEPTELYNFPGDLSQYIIRPLDVEASTRGYKETVCHGSFCCQFYVKTSVNGLKTEDMSYGLAAFDGVRRYGGNHNIGTQNCAVIACAGLYKRSCDIGSENNSTNIIFERISISANFTKRHSIQYPIIQSTEATSLEKVKFDMKTDRKSKMVTSDICDTQNLLSFGIFGRDFTKDTEMVFEKSDTTFDIYDIIDNDIVDYIWIRLRVLIFIVSIYVLEMM